MGSGNIESFEKIGYPAQGKLLQPQATGHMQWRDTGPPLSTSRPVRNAAQRVRSHFRLLQRLTVAKLKLVAV